MGKITYCVPISNKDKKDNETSVYRTVKFKDRSWYDSLEMKTLQDVYKKILENPNNKMLGYRKKLNDTEFKKSYTWITVKECFRQAEEIGSGLVIKNFAKENVEWNNKPFKFVGIWSKNCVNYVLTDIASAMYGITTIPIYDTLGEDATEFAFNQTKLETCFLTADKLPKIIKEKEKGYFKYLKNIIVFDYINFDTSLMDKLKGLVIMSIEDLRQNGNQNIQQWAKVTEETIYCFSYTSGTTGNPKGAMLSHLNAVSTAIAGDEKIKVYHDDIYVSYLPLAHVLERCFMVTVLMNRGRIGFYSGNMLKLTEDMKYLKPTLFVSVPRLFNKMYDKIHNKMSTLTGLKKFIATNGLKSKLDNLHKHGSTSHWFYDMTVFNKTKAILGGKVRIMAVGSAPINTDVLDYLKVVFCAPIIEGYGQTEACAFEFATDAKDGHSGHVGGPFSQNEFKLVDVPDMNYFSTDKDEQGNSKPRGEIWVRGINVIPGYYKLDAKNKETFTEDKWMKSGDVGMIDSTKGNRLQIIDRKKNIFKLAQGEYIAPEKLENVYKSSNPLLGDIFVYGDSLKSCLVAVINFEPANAIVLGKEYGVEIKEGENLNDNEDFKKKILEGLLKTNKETKLNSLEKIKGVYLDNSSWMDLNLITNSFKKKRNALKKHYQPQIDLLYTKLY